MNQVNSLAGEEAVGHAVVLAYVQCIRDTSKYAKPEVDPLPHHLSIALVHASLSFFFCVLTVSAFPLQKCTYTYS